MSFSKTNKSAAEALADTLREHFSSHPDQARIPAIRKIASDYGTSVSTAMYALRILENEGIILRRPNGSATIVRQQQTDRQQESKTASADDNKIKQIAVAGPIGPRSEYAWKDQWGIRTMLAAEQALLENSNFLPARVGVYGPDWPEAMQQ